jgi:hypothetical protein
MDLTRHVKPDFLLLAAGIAAKEVEEKFPADIHGQSRIAHRADCHKPGTRTLSLPGYCRMFPKGEINVPHRIDPQKTGIRKEAVTFGPCEAKRSRDGSGRLK